MSIIPGQAQTELHVGDHRFLVKRKRIKLGRAEMRIECVGLGDTSMMGVVRAHRVLTLVMLSLITSLTFADDGAIQPNIGAIFIEPPAPSRTVSVNSTMYTRARAVSIDWSRLDNVRVTHAEHLTLNLFDDAVFSATVERVANYTSGYSLSGRLDEYVNGRFNLVVYDDVLVGIVRNAGGNTYHIRYFVDGRHVVRQIDPATFPRCGVTPDKTRRFHNLLNDAVDRSTSRGMALEAAAAGSTDNGNGHDILVLYSNVTRQAAGGTSAIRAEIQLAIDAANDAYANSGIVSRLRLVHMEEILYDEDTGWDGYQDHLVRLGIPDDGYFDHIHELRDRVGADFVSLIVEDTDPDFYGNLTCGLAPVMQEISADFESLAFSVVSRVCSGDNWTLAHEVGHNQGCAHNREDAGVDGVFSYSYGHRFMGDTRGWGTIMAYNDAENTWQPIGQFSNPNLSHDGVATGVPIGSSGEAHNAHTINSSRVTIARFRTTRYWVDFDWSGTEDGLFDSPFNTLLEGLVAVPDGGMVVVKSGIHSAGMILSKRLKVNSWNGSTVIGNSSP